MASWVWGSEERWELEMSIWESGFGWFALLILGVTEAMGIDEIDPVRLRKRQSQDSNPPHMCLPQNRPRTHRIYS